MIGWVLVGCCNYAFANGCEWREKGGEMHWKMLDKTGTSNNCVFTILTITDDHYLTGGGFATHHYFFFPLAAAAFFGDDGALPPPFF